MAVILSVEQREHFKEQGFIVFRHPEIKKIKKEIHANFKSTILAILSYFPEFSKDSATLKSLSFEELFLKCAEHDRAALLMQKFYEIFPRTSYFISLANNNFFLQACQELKIDLPFPSTLPLIRIDKKDNRKFKVPIHQDIWYSMLSKNAVTFWFPLLSLDTSMGLLKVIPGSHKLGVLAMRRWDQFNPFTTREAFEENLFVETNVGDDEMLVFSQLLVHASGENCSERVRLTTQIRYNDLCALNELTSSFTAKSTQYVTEAQTKLLSADEK